MLPAKDLLELQYLEMRGRCLSLAADLDRIDKAPGGAGAAADARLVRLRDAIALLLTKGPDRAKRVQDLLSDHTPPPK